MPARRKCRSDTGNPAGSMIWASTLRQAQSRRIVPVFCGMSGWKSAIRISSRGRFDYPVLRFLQECDDVLSCHRRKSIEEIIDRFSRLQVVEQGLHRNSRTVKYGSAAHDVVASRYNWLLHNLN